MSVLGYAGKGDAGGTAISGIGSSPGEGREPPGISGPTGIGGGGPGGGIPGIAAGDSAPASLFS